jgi:hypothetical protein
MMVCNERKHTHVQWSNSRHLRASAQVASQPQVPQKHRPTMTISALSVHKCFAPMEGIVIRALSRGI